MNPLNAMVVTYLMNALWMICVVAAVTSLLSRVLLRCPASYRHALWVAALWLAVLLPLASLRNPQNSDKLRPESDVAASAMPAAEAGARGASSWALWRRIRHDNPPVFFSPLWTGLAALLYAGFLAYRVGRLGWGWRALRAMLRSSSEGPMPPAMRAVAKQCYSRLGVKPVPVLLSLEGHGPATLGIRNPVLILPEWFLAASEEEMSSALCHELAHIRRHDFLWNLVYEILLLPIAFHPAAALIQARINQTRELACDELAAESFSARAEYARSLLSIAESMGAKRQPAKVGYALGLFDTNSLEERVMNLLAKTNRIRKSTAQVSVLATLFLLLVTCLAVSGFSFQVTQPAKPDAKPEQFVGTWHAKFKGKTFLTIKLENKSGKLTGTVGHGNVSMNDAGELTEAEELEGSDPIEEAKITGEILRITLKEGDSKETDQFEMKVTGDDQAEIRMLAPPGVTAPWKMERAKVGQ